MSNNYLNKVVSVELVDLVKSELSKSDLDPESVDNVVRVIDENPLILNQLTLDHVSKLSVLGVDLSRYMTSVHLNNIKVFVIKYASDSMARVSKLAELLTKVEEKYYSSVIDQKYLHPKVASDMIDKIQQSITSSVDLMMKLTSNENLMNLFIINMNEINTNITNARMDGETDTKKILTPESRKKISQALEIIEKLADGSSKRDVVEDVVEAEVVTRDEYDDEEDVEVKDDILGELLNGLDEEE